MHPGFAQAGQSRLFQSTPAITGGRCQCPSSMTASKPCFNPRPPLLAGDANEPLRIGGRPQVSIHARHYWRAMPGARRICTVGSMFQSTPAITGGRCHAGHPRRQRCDCFNPRPPLLAGDATAELQRLRERLLFQSMPAITGGRCHPAWLQAGGPVVSIHARHYWRAMQPIRTGNALCQWVSIHARHYWRAMRLPSRHPAGRPRFQSTPAITGGRCWAPPINQQP